MTKTTSRFDIKPMFLGIPKIVMVVFCLLWAIGTSASRNMRKFTRQNSELYSGMGIALFSVLSLPLLAVWSSKIYAFFAFAISFLGLFSSFTFAIVRKILFSCFGFAKCSCEQFHANFTMRGDSVFCTFVSVKLIRWFNCFACWAILFFSHLCNPFRIIIKSLIYFIPQENGFVK